jgi:tetratricopeptide (TPR) repeat protein
LAFPQYNVILSAVKLFSIGLAAVLWVQAPLAAPVASPTTAPNSPLPGERARVRAALPSGITNTVSEPDPVDQEYHKIMEDDDTAQEEVDRWIKDNEEFVKQGAGMSPVELQHRIRERLEPIRKQYENFLSRHPDHAKARVAYGSFLGDLNDEEGAKVQLEKVLNIVTNDPAVYNNLANIYGHHGPVKKAFELYDQAIQLNPAESVYYENFGTTVFLFRPDAREYYGITEQQVFDKALNLYSNALRLDPSNFTLASEISQTYYGIKPPRTEEALRSWTNTLGLAHDELEREGVYIHFARLKLHSGRLDEARAHLNAITNESYAQLKARLTKNIEDIEADQKRTNHAATAQPKP